MKTWAKLCDIVSLNLKTKNLVVVVTTRFFLNDKILPKFKGLTLNVVPPQHDTIRTITVKSAKIKNETNKKLELEIEEDFDDDGLQGLSLLINMEDARKIFGDNIEDEGNNLLGKMLLDENNGEIGKVIDFAGTDAQKHLVIDYNNQEIYVPFVDEIIKSVGDNKIIAHLPAGLLEINEA